MKSAFLFSFLLVMNMGMAQTGKDDASATPGAHKKLRCGLYIDHTGDIYFRYLKLLNENGDRAPVYISWIYGADEADSLNGGLKEMKYVVDTSTFEILNDFYWADKYHVYEFTPMSDGGTVFLNRTIESKSLLVLGNSRYCTDSRSVYYHGKVVEGADKRSFKVLENIDVMDLACDKNHLYRMGEPMTQDEINTFQLSKCEE